MSLRNQIVRVMPDSLQRWVKRRYYPRVVRNFTEADWPFAASVHKLVPEGGVVLDIGANIGYLSKIFAGWVGNGGCVHSFEPIPETYAILLHNLRCLSLENIRPHNVALSNQRGTSTMQIPAYADGRPNLYESHLVLDDENGEGVPVDLDTLDHFIIDAVDFIKIDVEGHEWQVLQGGQELIARCLPPLLIEVEGNLAAEDSSAGKLNLHLAGLGYRPFILREKELVPWEDPYRAVDYLFLTSAQQALLA